MLSTRRRPDRGVFETLLVVDGRAVEADAHLWRLERSLVELYGQGAAKVTGRRLNEAAASLALGRVRLAAAPGNGEIELTIEADEIDPEITFPSQGVRLHTRSFPGGLGPHKLLDRPAEIERPGPGETGALLCDEGEALEAGWANVFAVRGGTLFTPPLDGRILPGTTRAALLELAAREGIETSERALCPGDLLAADEVFLSSSIRGIEPALELDEKPLPGCGQISRRLAAALRQRWGLASDQDVPQAAAPAPIADQLSH